MALFTILTDPARRALSTVPGDAANGVRLPCAALLVADQLADSDAQKAIGLDYVKTYTGKYGGDVSTFGGHAYDALFLAVEALTSVGGTDKAKVRDAIEATKNFVGVDGIFNMSAIRSHGIEPEFFQNAGGIKTGTGNTCIKANPRVIIAAGAPLLLVGAAPSADFLSLCLA